MPSVVGVGISRISYELKTYVRTPDSMFFNFFFPLLMFAVFTVAFSQMEIDVPGAGRVLTSPDIYLPAMLAMSVIVSGAQNLGIDMAIEKHDGTLRRLSGSPMSPVSYFIGKFGQVFVSATLQAIVLIFLARFAFGAYLPASGDRWVTVVWVFYLGLIASSILGVALSALPRSAKSATSVILPPILVLQFISGVFLAFASLPGWLQSFASFFPLKWIGQGFRAALYPDALKAAEVGGEWHLDQVALALVVWIALGFVATLLTFKWVKRS